MVKWLMASTNMQRLVKNEAAQSINWADKGATLPVGKMTL